MLQTGHHRQHHRQPGDDRPKRTGGRQGAGACCFFFARGVRAHIRGSAPEPQRVSCCAADAWSARLMACATSVGGKSAVGRAAPVRVAYRWCDSLPPVLATNTIRTLPRYNAPHDRGPSQAAESIVVARHRRGEPRTGAGRLPDRARHPRALHGASLRDGLTP